MYFESCRICKRFIANRTLAILRFAHSRFDVGFEAATFAEFATAKLTFQKRLKKIFQKVCLVLNMKEGQWRLQT